ncbi:MAG: hypothetical protein PF444_01455 [Bacteroidales bacterium]|jgi:hypothetical protein|nr:hypothetical protein [Bacteroidales bacterium]
MYKNIDDSDNVIDDKDRTYLGSPLPDYTLGLNLSTEYKGFSFSMFFDSSIGNKAYNYTKWYTDFAQNGNFNHGISILNAWSPVNTNTSVPSPTLVNENLEDRYSSYFIEDASYVKLRSVRLGYLIPQKLTPGFTANIYGELQYVFTLTSYSGIDPEVPHAEGALNFPGHVLGVYPLPRTFTIGLKLNL